MVLVVQGPFPERAGWEPAPTVRISTPSISGLKLIFKEKNASSPVVRLENPNGFHVPTSLFRIGFSR